ncbi:hypothetical protein SFC43_05875 [Bacteroides sp. CR5/BHMF/2]|nr:hypothetical protein [Bacteroides sp. CR5/BHMF/2]
MDIARGEWCWFVDSDDVIDSNIPIDMSLLECKDIVVFDILYIMKENKDLLQEVMHL